MRESVKRIIRYTFFEYFIRKIRYLKSKKYARTQRRQLLSKVMLHPPLTIELKSLDELIRYKGVSFITEDELAMKWAEHSGHL